MKNKAFLGLFLLLSACNQNLQSPQGPKTEVPSSPLETLGQNEQAELPKITVMNIFGEPLVGARIMWGNRLNQPFANNLMETDRQGQVMAPPEWNGPLAITVDHSGYLRMTYLAVSPQSLTFKLRPFEKQERIELSGITTDFGPLKKNNVADFGLVIASLTKKDLFTFNINKLISPEMDVMEIAGVQSSVPSNFTFPRQRESYVIPVTLDKERYRLYFNEPGSKKIYALHGKFPFKEVVDKITSKVPFPNLVNYFEFTSGSMKEIMLTGPTSIDLPVNELQFSSQDHVTPPQVDADKVLLTISLFENNGYLYPTDLQKVESPNTFALKGLQNSNRFLMSMVTRKEDFDGTSKDHQEAVSAELITMQANNSPQLLNLIPRPAANPTGWKTQAPTLDHQIVPLTTYSVLSKVSRQGKQKLITRLWEVYSEQWVNNADIPEWPFSNPDPLSEAEQFGGNVQNSGLRWEVTFVGTNQKLPLPMSAHLGPQVVDYATHISFNSVEF